MLFSCSLRFAGAQVLRFSKRPSAACFPCSKSSFPVGGLGPLLGRRATASPSFHAREHSQTTSCGHIMHSARGGAGYRHVMRVLQCRRLRWGYHFLGEKTANLPGFLTQYHRHTTISVLYYTSIIRDIPTLTIRCGLSDWYSGCTRSIFLSPFSGEILEVLK